MAGLYYEQFSVGQVFEHSIRRTVTEMDNVFFSAITHNPAPLHIDEEYARKSVFSRRVAHGILTAAIISTVLGGEIPGLGTIFVELQIRFLKPVFFGDTVTARATVTEIINPKRVRLMVACTNQHGEDVAIGSTIVIPPVQTRLIS